MATFGIQPTTGINDRTGALNYALNNIGQGLQVDIYTGKISAPNTDPRLIYQLTYRYAVFTFADDAYGNGINLYPDGKLYYGIYSFDIPAGATFVSPPLTPQNYTWYAFNPPGPAPVGSALFYANISPYQISSVYLDTAGSNPSPGYKEFYSGLTYYQIDTFDYIAPTAVQLTTTTFTTITCSETLTLSPQNAQPVSYFTGTIAMADAVNWDPATYSTSTPYLAVYNGTTWVALG